MALIIDLSYFVEPIRIPNLELNNNVVSNNDAVSSLMDYYERDFLINALGLASYNELVTAMADLPNADVKWRNLVNGTDKWVGLRYVDAGGHKRSIIAEYVFCQFLYSIDEQVTQAGVFIENVKNARRVTNWDLIVKRWNIVSIQYLDLIRFLRSDFPDSRPCYLPIINSLGL